MNTVGDCVTQSLLIKQICFMTASDDNVLACGGNFSMCKYYFIEARTSKFVSLSEVLYTILSRLYVHSYISNIFMRYAIFSR